jgi:hypothetical protein
MKKIIFIILILAATGLGQSSRSPVKIMLYYPGDGKPETLTLPDNEPKTPVKDWKWWRSDGCLVYMQSDEMITFCGTYKIIKKKE